MKWGEIITALIIAALSASGGSYVTHSHDVVHEETALDNSRMSCSEVIQLVLSNK